MQRWISLLTDFGLDDTYVAQMKAVIGRLAPDARVIDLTHSVAPGAVANGAYLLETSWHSFPQGSIHVAVVDPGVGTEREPLLMEAHGHYWIGPDNGLLERALRDADSLRAWRLNHPQDREIAPTFHGRDLFAPAAARLAAGAQPADIAAPVHWTPSPPERSTHESIVHIDRFGNVALDWLLPEQEAAQMRVGVRIGETVIDQWVNTFGDLPAGQLGLLRNSAGYAEVVLNGESAAERLEAELGDSWERLSD